MADILPPLINERDVRIPRKSGTVRICDRPTKYCFLPKFREPTYIIYRSGTIPAPVIFNRNKYTGWRKDAAKKIAEHHNGLTNAKN